MIDRYGDAGIDFLGLNDGRPHDKFGIAFGYAQISQLFPAGPSQYQHRDFAIVVSMEASSDCSNGIGGTLLDQGRPSNLLMYSLTSAPAQEHKPVPAFGSTKEKWASLHRRPSDDISYQNRELLYLRLASNSREM